VFPKLSQFFKKFCPTIGIDLGSTSIKTVEIKGSLPNLQLVNVYKTDFSSAVMQNGELIDKELVVNALEVLVNKFAWKGKQVVASADGRSLLIRHFKMPVMPERELKEALRFELEAYLPFGTQELVIDYANLGLIAGKKHKQCLILVAAIPKAIALDYYEIFSAVGLDLVAIDIIPLALQRSLAVQEKTGVTAFAEIGTETITFFILVDGKVSFIRNITLSSKLISKERFSYQEQAAASGNLSFRSEGREYELEISRELRRSFDMWSQSNNTGISKLVISGEICSLAGIEFLLNRQLGVAVEVGKPLAGLIKGERQIDPEYAVAAGLALREVIN